MEEKTVVDVAPVRKMRVLLSRIGGRIRAFFRKIKYFFYKISPYKSVDQIYPYEGKKTITLLWGLVVVTPGKNKILDDQAKEIVEEIKKEHPDLGKERLKWFLTTFFDEYEDENRIFDYDEIVVIKKGVFKKLGIKIPGNKERLEEALRSLEKKTLIYETRLAEFDHKIYQITEIDSRINSLLENIKKCEDKLPKEERQPEPIKYPIELRPCTLPPKKPGGVSGFCTGEVKCSICPDYPFKDKTQTKGETDARSKT